MTPIHYLLGIAFGLSLTVGQILFKIAANQMGVDGQSLSIFRVLFTAPMIAAVVLYGLTVILYVYILQQIPLNRAYLFTFIASGLVPILAAVIFKEPVSARYIVGTVLIFIGLAIATTGPSLSA